MKKITATITDSQVGLELDNVQADDIVNTAATLVVTTANFTDTSIEYVLEALTERLKDVKQKSGE